MGLHGHTCEQGGGVSSARRLVASGSRLKARSACVCACDFGDTCRDVLWCNRRRNEARRLREGVSQCVLIGSFRVRVGGASIYGIKWFDRRGWASRARHDGWAYRWSRARHIEVARAMP